MKAISVRQPWAWLIVNGYKDIENRTWSTDYRGPILIHASLTPDRDAIAEFMYAMQEDGIDLSEMELRRGGIVGRATVVDCVTEHESEWFIGPYGFVLEDAEPVEFMPARGRLKFFDIDWPPRPE